MLPVKTPQATRRDTRLKKIKRPRFLAALGTKILLWCRYFVVGVVGAGVAGFVVVVAGLVPEGLDPSEPVVPPAGFAGAGTPDCEL
jgi:hypothetical protein